MAQGDRPRPELPNWCLRDGELRKTRLFRSHEQAELVGAIADTRGDVRREAKG
jgi:hypothetical protein